MGMGGMDMTGFRMIPAGMGIMTPAHAPWRPDGVRIRIRHVDRDDGRHDDALSDAHDSHVRPCGPTRRGQGTPLAATGWFVAGYFLAWVGFRSSPPLCNGRSSVPLARFPAWQARATSSEGSCSWRRVPTSGRRSRTCALPNARRRFRSCMRHGGFRRDVPGCLLLGLRHGAYCVGCCWASDGAVVRGRRDERALDRAARVTRPLGEAHPRSDGGSRAPPALLVCARAPGC